VKIANIFFLLTFYNKISIEGATMKRIFIFLFYTLIILTLSACIKINYVSYDDLLLQYQDYISEQEEIYQLRIDYFNHLSTESIKSVVQVIKSVPRRSQSTGSGVIFREDNDYYYALTNNHVVFHDGLGIATYSIIDYLGNNYTSQLLYSNSNYDLAIMRFSKTNSSLKVVSFSSSVPNIDEEVSVIGFPSSQVNAITLGKVVRYSKENVTSNNETIINVDFDVMVTNVPVKYGSSGSMTLNSNFELVGIIYAGQFIESEISNLSFVIPIEKVIEFISISLVFGGDIE